MKKILLVVVVYVLVIWALKDDAVLWVPITAACFIASKLIIDSLKGNKKG